MKFKEIIEQIDPIEVVNRMPEMYEEQHSNMVGYMFMLDDLKEMEPEDSEYTICIKYVTKDFDDTDLESPYYDVCGRKEDEDDRYAMEFVKWAEWLGSDIDMDSVGDMTPEDIAIHCIWEMTFCGFEEVDIQERIADLEKRVEDIESGKVECIPWEDVKKNIEDKLGIVTKLEERLDKNEFEIKVAKDIIDEIETD